LTTDRDYYTRAANEDCINGGPRTRTKYTYDAYGNKTTVSGTLVSDIGYAGYFYHAVSGLDFALFRAYDPAHARWLNRDPIGELGGINLYGYANGNPVSNYDPSGLDCVTANGQAVCSTPGGPAFVVPAPANFPAYLGPSNLLYHYYDVHRDLGCADSNDVSQGLINSPTPGTSAPATPNGTTNNAVVPFFPLNLFDNPVTSYLTMDVNTGAALVVNITGPGSLFGPGYVARYVTGGVAHTIGEGTNPIQSPIIISPFIQYAADEALWGSQMSNIIGKSKSKCGCAK
jgi:RHS repeat-associated protein